MQDLTLKQLHELLKDATYATLKRDIAPRTTFGFGGNTLMLKYELSIGDTVITHLENIDHNTVTPDTFPNFINAVVEKLKAHAATCPPNS